MGAGEDLTVIDGRQRGSVVRVNNAALDLENSIVSSNSATQSGGGIDLGASTVPAKIASSVVVHNRAGGAGGGIAVEAECVAQISNSSITRNTAGTAGGGIFAEGASQSTIQGTTLSDNTSQQDGGGIFVDDGRPKPIISIATSSLVGNRAARNGGGLFNEGRLTLGASVIEGNNLPADPQP